MHLIWTQMQIQYAWVVWELASQACQCQDLLGNTRLNVRLCKTLSLSLSLTHGAAKYTKGNYIQTCDGLACQRLATAWARCKQRFRVLAPGWTWIFLWETAQCHQSGIARCSALRTTRSLADMNQQLNSEELFPQSFRTIFRTLDTGSHWPRRIVEIAAAKTFFSC